MRGGGLFANRAFFFLLFRQPPLILLFCRNRIEIRILFDYFYKVFANLRLCFVMVSKYQGKI